MNLRRNFLKKLAKNTTTVWMTSALSGCGGGSSAATANTTSYLMPAEDAAHLGTYMALASSSGGIWSAVTSTSTNAGIARTQQDLIDVAKAIGTYEPVTMLIKTSADFVTAQNLMLVASAANSSIHTNYTNRTAGRGGVTLTLVTNGFDDYWLRDTGSVFVKDTANSSKLCAINFNFNGWGNANTNGVGAGVSAAGNRSKAGSFYQPFNNDQKIAPWMATANSAALTSSSLTLEGGAIEFDGAGTAILTESSVLHVNRNPQLFNTAGGIAVATLLPTAKATVLAELNRTLGVKKIIWLPGTAVYPAGAGVGAAGGASTPSNESDITNGHVDFYAKFLAPNVVAYALDSSNAMGERAITQANLTALTGQTNANGVALTLVPLVVPSQFGTSVGVTLNSSQQSNFAAGYINFYACNGAVLMPKFNDPTADAAAITAITPYLNGRTIVQIDILGIAAGGGGIHCATCHIPA